MQTPDPPAEPTPAEVKPVASLGRRVATAAVWTIGVRLADRLLGVASTFVLARLLLPEDYGIVAMAMVVIAFIEIFAGIGVDSALISKADADRHDYDGAWTLNAAIGVALWLLITACSYPASIYFGTPDVLPVIACLAVMPLLSGFENIGVVDFRKQLRFDKDAIFTVSKRLVGLAVTIPLAFLWRNHWSLVAGMLAGRAAGLALSYLMSPYRPGFSLLRVREIFQFSKWLLVSNVLMFFRFRTSELIVGRMHGATALGLFNMSSELASIPSSELVMPVNRALFPGYALVSGDPGRLKSGFLKALGLLSLLTVPASVGLSLVAGLAVPLLLGPSWLETIPIIQILAIAGISGALQINNWSIFMALRRPDMLVKVSLVHITALFIAMFVLVPPLGAQGAAWANLTAGLVSLPFNYAKVASVLKLSVAELLAPVWRPVVASAVMYAAVTLGAIGTAAPGAPYPSLLAGLLTAVAAGAGVYAAALALLWLGAGRPDSAERMVLDALSPRVTRILQRLR